MRVEDGLTTLILWNNLLDDTVSGHFNVAGVTDFSQFDCKNNVHVEDSPHAACTGNGNLLVDLNDVAGAFVNYGAGNYKLADPSVLVNAGVAIASVTHDIEGDARPIGSVWDVGPYEDDVSEPGGSPPPSTDNEFWDSEIERIAGECTLPCDGTTGDVVLSISYRSDDTWSLPTPPITGQSVLDYIDQTGVDPLNDVSHDAAEDAIRMWKHVNGSESDFLCMRENCLTGASAETLGPFANDDMWIEVDIKVGDWRYFAWSNYSGLKFMRGAYSDAGPGTCDGGSARMFDWNPGAMQSPGDFGNMIRVRPYCGGTWLSGNEVFRHPLNEWVRYRIHWNLTSGAWKVWAKVLTGAEAGDYMLLDSETANGNHAGRAVAIEMSYSSSSGSYDDPGYTSKPDYPYLKTWVKNFYLGQGCIRMGAEDPTCD